MTTDKKVNDVNEVDDVNEQNEMVELELPKGWDTEIVVTQIGSNTNIASARFSMKNSKKMFKQVIDKTITEVQKDRLPMVDIEDTKFWKNKQKEQANAPYAVTLNTKLKGSLFTLDIIAQNENTGAKIIEFTDKLEEGLKKIEKIYKIIAK